MKERKDEKGIINDKTFKDSTCKRILRKKYCVVNTEQRFSHGFCSRLAVCGAIINFEIASLNMKKYTRTIHHQHPLLPLNFKTMKQSTIISLEEQRNIGNLYISKSYIEYLIFSVCRNYQSNQYYAIASKTTHILVSILFCKKSFLFAFKFCFCVSNQHAKLVSQF